MAEKIFSVKRGPDDEVIFSFKQPKFEFAVDAREHARAASKEILLAFRSLIDDAISTIEGKEEKKSKKTTKIKVE
jgi:hypothetical protein